MMILDTNILVRLIVKDGGVDLEKAYLILENINQGLITAKVSPVIIAEVIFVLTAKGNYGLRKTDFIDSLFDILLVENILIEEKDIVFLAIKYYSKYSLGFADCYLLAKKQIDDLDGILTFDKKLLKTSYDL